VIGRYKEEFVDGATGAGETLVAIATETEQTAERFRRDKAYLDNSTRYFRFNIVRGLEDIGLEESAKRKEIAINDAKESNQRPLACLSPFNVVQYPGKYSDCFYIPL